MIQKMRNLHSYSGKIFRNFILFLIGIIIPVIFLVSSCSKDIKILGKWESPDKKSRIEFDDNFIAKGTLSSWCNLPVELKIPNSNQPTLVAIFGMLEFKMYYKQVGKETYSIYFPLEDINYPNQVEIAQLTFDEQRILVEGRLFEFFHKDYYKVEIPDSQYQSIIKFDFTLLKNSGYKSGTPDQISGAKSDAENIYITGAKFENGIYRDMTGFYIDSLPKILQIIPNFFMTDSIRKQSNIALKSTITPIAVIKGYLDNGDWKFISKEEDMNICFMHRKKPCHIS
jgi:hypothetical protein